MDRGQGARFTHAPTFERLEPRILLSGDFGTSSLLDPFVQTTEEQAIYVDLHPGSKIATQFESSKALEVLPESDTDLQIETQAYSLVVNPASEESSESSQPIAASELRQAADIQIGVQLEQTPGVASSASLTSVVPEGSAPMNLDSLAGEAIQIRGPPEDVGQASSLPEAYPTVETDVLDARNAVYSRNVEDLASPTIPVLPGLQLVDPDTIRWAGQVIFLDFDGAKDVTYNGPVTVGPFDVPAFLLEGTPMAGQEQQVIAEVVSNLEHTFAGSGVVFTTERPAQGQAYSTVYIGGDDSAFSQHGSFLGLAEQVDVGNIDLRDEGWVFSDQVAQAGVDKFAARLALPFTRS